MQMGTVSGAARRLNVSQPAITKSLQLLEAHLKMTLFERIKGRLQPTPDCEALMPEIERLFSTLTSVERVADEIRSGQKGHVKIAAVGNLAASLVAVAVARFTESRPAVRIEIQALSTRKVAEEVSNNQVDLGLTDVPFPGGYFESIELCRSQIACIVPRSHPLADRAHVTPKDLAHCRIISFADDTMTGWMLREAFRAQGVAYPQYVVTNQTMTACVLAQLGAGVALVDAFPLLPQAPAELAVLPFRPTVEFRPTVICPPARPVSVVADQFIDCLLATTKEMIKQSPLLRSI